MLNPEIKLEKDLQGQIYNALQGDVVKFVLKNAEYTSDSDNYWRSKMEGHCMKADENLLGGFYKLCHEVKDKLGYKEEVDFYVTGDSTINAYSIAAEGDQPDIVNVNSELFNLMSEDELRFVIGHELGHLINKDTELKRLIWFVYPPQTTCPPVALQYKIRLHDNLAELVADRYGYLACENLGACVTAFFKMASGLDLQRMEVGLGDLLIDNTKHLDFFLNGGGMSHYDHPVNPIRIEAINLFANALNQEALDKGMDQLIQILLKLGNGPLDGPMSVFIATAGIITANIDGKVEKEEYEYILKNLSNSLIFPRDFLAQVAKGDVDKMFEQSVNQLIQYDPSLKPALLDYIVGMVLADKDITEKEVNFIYHIGQQLGLSVKEISQIFAGQVQRNYVPSLDSIS